MTHLPFIAAAYGLTIAAGLFLSLQAAFRLRRARRALAAANLERRPPKRRPLERRT